MKFAKKFFLGLAIGAGIGLALYALGGVFECVCFPCHCLGFMDYADESGGFMLPFMWSGEAFRNTMLFCMIGSAIFGGIWGAVEQAPDNKKAKAERETENASVLRNELTSLTKLSNNLISKATLSFSDLQYHHGATKKETERCINDSKLQQDIARKLVEKY